MIMGNEAEGVKERDLNPGKAFTHGKINPSEENRSDRDRAANNQEPEGRPDTPACLQAGNKLPDDLHEFRLSFAFQEAIKGEMKFAPSRAC